MKRLSALLILPSTIFLFACGQAKKPAAPTASSEPPPAVDAAPAMADAPARGPGGPGGGGPGGGQGRQMRSPEDRVKAMQASLGLTQDQADQILAIIQSQQPAMAALRDNQSLSREESRAQRDALRQEMDAKMAAILTPEQKAKWEQERAARRAEMNNRPGGPGGGPGPGQAPAGGG